MVGKIREENCTAGGFECRGEGRWGEGRFWAPSWCYKGQHRAHKAIWGWFMGTGWESLGYGG